MSKEIEENNTVIHDWMGARRMNPPFEHEWIGQQKASDLKYHSDWNWLMPCVEKICDYQYPIEEDDIILDYAHLRTFGMKDEDTGFYMVRFSRCGVFIGETLIEATYAAVIDFITYYN